MALPGAISHLPSHATMNAPARLCSPAAERNRQPLLEVLRRVLPPTGHALEIASGSGQHVAWFARHLPGWTWQPTDVDERALASIAAWCYGDESALAQPDDAAPLANVEPPRRLDVLEARWDVPRRFDAIVCANMLHIAPWACCAALMRGAAHHLVPTGILVTYGPYFVEGEPAAAGNVAFDADLRARDPGWGVRWLHEVAAEAERAGLYLRGRVAMPANNLTLVFGRGGPREDRSDRENLP
jgi:SAM-dependent methyltransferase